MREIIRLMLHVLQKSDATIVNTDSPSTLVGHQRNSVSTGDGIPSTNSTATPARLPQTCSKVVNGTDELDSEDTVCIPDTQFVQPLHHPPEAFSPDVEMIPDTPDSGLSTGVRRTFQRSYLASASDLFAASDGCLRKKASPSRRKITKDRSHLRKHTGFSATNLEERVDLSVADGVSLQSNISPSALRPAAAAHLPYPSFDMVNKRCATDPFPLSKRCDHKVTPTKPVPSTNCDVVYGTVPGRLFQEALYREKRQQLSNPRTNKENAKPVAEICKSPDLDSDPMLLEVLSELKMDSPKHEGLSEQNVSISVSPRATDTNVSDDVSTCDKTVDNHLETLYGDDDLEDILGELRQQNGIKHMCLNDAKKNPSSCTLTDVEENPSVLCNPVPVYSSYGNIVDDKNLTIQDKSPTRLSLNDVVENQSVLSNSVPVYSSSQNIVDNENLAIQDKSHTHKEVCDFKPADLKLEERASNSAKNLTDGPMKSERSDVVEVRRPVNDVSVSCLPSECGDTNNEKIDGKIDSANCDQRVR